MVIDINFACMVGYKQTFRYFLDKLFLKAVVANRKRFDLYAKMMEQLDENIIAKSYITFNIYEKLKVDGIIEHFKPDIEYSTSNILDDNFKLTFRQPLRRI